MYKKITGISLLIVSFILTNCTSQTLVPKELTVTTTMATVAVVNPTLEVNPTSTTTATTIALITPLPTLSATSIPVPSSVPAPMSSEQLHLKACPTVVDREQQLLTGSILFGTGELLNEYAHPYDPYSPGIWAVSHNNLVPVLAYSIPESQSSWVTISDDGTNFLKFERLERTSNTEGAAVVYDLNNHETLVRIPLNPVGGGITPRWLPDGKIKYLADRERIDGQGEIRQYTILDLKTATSQTIKQEYDLPGYGFSEDPGLYLGYASISPTEEHILYTAIDEAYVRSAVLYDQTTNTVIWTQADAFPHPIEPVWNIDSSHVLLPVTVPVVDSKLGRYQQFITVNTVGQVEELPGQPYPETGNARLRHLSRSPDERYIHYVIWGSTLHTGNGYIVDPDLMEVGMVCHAGAAFTSGIWISDKQFVYRMLVNEEDIERHAMYLLDIPSWTSQLLYEAPAGYGINIFGWTPEEFD